MINVFIQCDECCRSTYPSQRDLPNAIEKAEMEGWRKIRYKGWRCPDCIAEIEQGDA